MVNSIEYLAHESYTEISEEQLQDAIYEAINGKPIEAAKLFYPASFECLSGKED